jgi:hypothetical protein
MPPQIDIADLYKKSYAEQFADYANAIEDGKAIELSEVCSELGVSLSAGRAAAKKAGVAFNAHIPGVTGGCRAMIANPRTVKEWHAAQKKLPPQKR